MPDSVTAQHSPSRYVGAIEAGAWLLIAGLLLRIVPFGRLFRAVRPEVDRTAFSPAEESLAQSARDSVGAAARRVPWKPACLASALAGALMCRCRGVRVPIALSVAAREGHFAAHARLDGRDDAELAIAVPEGRTHLGRVLLTF
jgi:hypothetical protein